MDASGYDSFTPLRTSTPKPSSGLDFFNMQLKAVVSPHYDILKNFSADVSVPNALDEKEWSLNSSDDDIIYLGCFINNNYSSPKTSNLGLYLFVYI